MRSLFRATLAAAVLTAALAATPAHGEGATSDETREQAGVSLDGIHYRDSLRRPLFGPSVRWAPGDVRTGRFFVRHRADQRLTIDVLPGDVEELFDGGQLAVEARAGEGAWRSVTHEGALRLVTPADLPADAKVQVAVRVGLAADVPRGTRVRATDFDVEVATDEVAIPDRVSAQSATWWVVPLGLLLLAGAALLYGRREYAYNPRVSGSPR
jgi:hypothetical protein